jgi:hypothetical protein
MGKFYYAESAALCHRNLPVSFIEKSLHRFHFLVFTFSFSLSSAPFFNPLSYRRRQLFLGFAAYKHANMAAWESIVFLVG